MLSVQSLLAAPRVFADSAGRQITLPDTINRVMAAGPPAAVLLYTLAPDKMIGWVQAFDAGQAAFLAEPYRSLPRHGRITARENAPDAATIRALKPDIILDSGDVDERYVALANRIQAETGIPYVLLDGSLQNSPAIYWQLGDLLGTPKRADDLAKAAERILTAARAQRDSRPANQRPRVFFAQGPDGLDAAHSAPINRELLDLVGAADITAHTAHHGAPLTIEQVRAANPAVIVTLDADFQRTAFANDAWRDIDAARSGRVFLSPSAPFGWLDTPPGVNRLMGAVWLSHLLYASPADLRAATKDFYARFYHLPLTDSQLDRLLPPASTSQTTGDRR